MAFSFALTTASGSTPNVTVPFGFISRDDVHVTLDAVAVDDATLTWLSDGQIQLASTPASGTIIKVYRSTPKDSINTQFANPNVFDGADINKALLQMLYVTQEAFDVGTANSDDLAAITDYVNTAMATANDSATAAAMSATAAAMSATAAATSKTNAATSETNAAAYAATVQAIATGTFVLISGWDASIGSFPAADVGTVDMGWLYNVTAEGTVDGQVFNIGDALYALKADPATDTYGNNWRRISGGQRPQASATEVVAGTDDTKAVTAKALHDAGVLVPVGTKIEFNGDAAPPGFLKENGAELSRTTYAALWAHAQTSGMLVTEANWAATSGSFSSGDGSTTFRIPDSRGEFTRGYDDSRGVDSGRALGSNQADDLKSHTHPVGSSVVNANASSPLSYSPGGNSTVTSGATGGTETRPRNITKLACIKY